MGGGRKAWRISAEAETLESTMVILQSSLGKG